jgi:hypothetical protein
MVIVEQLLIVFIFYGGCSALFKLMALGGEVRIKRHWAVSSIDPNSSLVVPPFPIESPAAAIITYLLP